MKGQGPVGRFTQFEDSWKKKLMKRCDAEEWKLIAVFSLACGERTRSAKNSICCLARDKIAHDLNIIDKDKFACC